MIQLDFSVTGGETREMNIQMDLQRVQATKQIRVKHNIGQTFV